MRSLESRQRTRESAIKAWSNPEIRKKQTLAIIEARNKPECNAKLHKALTGKKRTPEARKKMSESAKRARNLPGVKEKMRESQLEIWSDAEYRKHMSEVHIGQPNPRKGKKMPKEFGEKISAAKIKRTGGKSFEPYCPKFNARLKEEIRNKFGHRCFLCGSEGGSRRLSVHHVDYNKGQGCGQTWSLIPLCASCHIKTNTDRWYWFNLLNGYWINRYQDILMVAAPAVA